MSSTRRDEYVQYEKLLDERLQILLERLTWSYVALWILNPRTRVFEWRRGHFNQALGSTKEGTTLSSSSPSLWDAELFYTTFKSCSIAPGTGAVGRANLEAKHIWSTGDSVCQNAASLEQSQFLRCAKIQTTMCIPWVDSVLELGTTKLVGENFLLMDQIQQVLSNDLLEADPFEHASGSTGPASSATMFQSGLHQDSSHAQLPTNLALEPPSSMGCLSRASNERSGFRAEFSLCDQLWRSENSPNLSLSSDIFIQESVIQQDSHANRVTENLSCTLETGVSMPLQMPLDSAAPAVQYWRPSEIKIRDSQQAVNQSHGLMVSQADQNRSSSSAATSSSVSSQGEHSSPRPSISPDQLQQQIHGINSSPKSNFSAHDRASFSGRQTLHSQIASSHTTPASGSRHLNQRRRTTSCGDQDEIQKAVSLFEAQEVQEQWRRQALLHLESELAANSDATVPGRSPSPAQYNESTDWPGGQNSLQFQVWQRDVTGSPEPTLPIQSNDLSKRPNVKRSNASIMNQVSKVAGPLLRRQSLSALEVLKEVDMYHKVAAEDVLKIHQTCEEPRPSHMQINAPNLKGRPGTVGVLHAKNGGPVHACHDEAAVSHMLAERRRRVKQKENFIELRRLVPIISKADKASTLVDAITYLKHLQNQIQEMETSNEDIDKRCQSLGNKCKKLEERNQELMEIISKNQPSNLLHFNHLKLQSTKST